MALFKRCLQRKGVLLLACVLLAIVSWSQLHVKDSIPDLYLKLLNQDEKCLSEIVAGDKPIVMQVWSTKCDGSIESFRHIDNLQRKYDQKIQFLIITNEDRNIVKRLLDDKGYIGFPKVPVVVEAKEILGLLPREGMPYSVWIDSNRVIQYISPSYNTTEAHLDSFLKRKPLEMRHTGVARKKGSIWEMGSSHFLDHVKFYSALTRCIDQYEITSPGNQSSKGIEVLSFDCYTLPQLIKIAYSEGGKVDINNNYSLEIELSDSLYAKRPADKNLWDEWRRQYLFSYNLIVPEAKKGEIYKIMQSDLERYFGLRVTRVKKEIKGYRLQVIPGKKVIESKSEEAYDAYYDGNVLKKDLLEFRKQPVDRLNYLLKIWIGFYYPFESGSLKNCMIDFKIRRGVINPPEIEMINYDLKNINLELQPVKKKVEVIRVSN